MLKSNLQYISTKIYFYDSSKELMMFNTPQQLSTSPSNFRCAETRGILQNEEIISVCFFPCQNILALTKVSLKKLF